MVVLNSSSHMRRKFSQIFYVDYGDFCKRQNANPSSIIKMPTKQKGAPRTDLEFYVDNIKFEEWTPILAALRVDNTLQRLAVRCRQRAKSINDSLDTEAKIKALPRNRPPILTKLMLTRLIDVTSHFSAHSQVLVYLEIDGLPLSNDMITSLMRGISTTRTLRHLNLRYCLVADDGCEIIGRTLRYISNVATLDLTGCEITPAGVHHLAALIKYQKICRYSESWKQTLRYRLPELDRMRGLRRLTLNGNKGIGDRGFLILIDVLLDDLWIKAVDIQSCNITERGVLTLGDFLNMNDTIEVLDLRNNQIPDDTVRNLIMILNNRVRSQMERNDRADRSIAYSNDPERFEWLSLSSKRTVSSLNSNTSSSMRLGCNSSVSNNSKASISSNSNMSSSSIRSIPHVRTSINLNSKTLIRSASNLSGNRRFEANKRQQLTSKKNTSDISTSSNPEVQQLRTKVMDLETRLDEEKAQNKRLEELNGQLHAQLMAAMGKIDSYEKNDSGMFGDRGDEYTWMGKTGGKSHEMRIQMQPIMEETTPPDSSSDREIDEIPSPDEAREELSDSQFNYRRHFEDFRAKNISNNFYSY